MKRVAFLALAAVALAACGSSGRLSKSEYQAKLKSAFTTAFDRVQTLDATPESVAMSYSGLASNLKGLHPPANVRSLNDQLVAGASEQAAALNALAARVKDKPKLVRDRILAQFDPSDVAGRQEFDSAVTALEAKGYKFRPSGGT